MEKACLYAEEIKTSSVERSSLSVSQHLPNYFIGWLAIL